MSIKTNQKIIANTAKSVPKECYIQDSYVMANTRLNGFLEHILIRLYTGFHIHIKRNECIIQQLSLIVHLHLINLHVTRNDKLSVTLSSFGRDVMNRLMLHQKNKITYILNKKDKLKFVLSLVGLIFSTIIFIIGFISAIKIINTDKTIYEIPLCHIFFNMIFVLFLVGLIGACIWTYKKREFLSNYKIHLHDILIICTNDKGQKQAKREKKYIIKYFDKQYNLLRDLAYNDTQASGSPAIQWNLSKIGTHVLRATK